MSKRIVCLGEILMRLSAPSYQRLSQADSFQVNYGGSEANVASALCHFGMQAAFVTKVPDTAIGQSAINHLRQFGVDTSHVVRGGQRLGIYFLEQGASLRASQVIYDRQASAFADAEAFEFDFDQILDGADWFHTSGISPALSDKALEITENALQTARRKGITTSIDLNYRKKLWTEERAAQVMSRLCRYADVCIGADSSLGIQSEKLRSGSDIVGGFRELFEKLKAEFSFKVISATIRKSLSASDNELSSLVYDGIKFHESRNYPIHIVDRVGSGDAYAAGLIFGILSGMPLGEAGEFATASAALKHTIPGDTNCVSKEEVMAVLNGVDSGRVQR